MTVEELRLTLSEQFQKLSGAILPDDAVLGNFFEEAKIFVSNFVQVDSNAERILYPLYVATKLLERNGLFDLADKYWQRFKETLQLLSGQAITEPTRSDITVQSDERVFDETELEKW